MSHVHVFNRNFVGILERMRALQGGKRRSRRNRSKKNRKTRSRK